LGSYGAGHCEGGCAYISTDPEFSWSGTGFILGASAIVGLVMGLARRRRMAGGSGYWRLTVASLGLLGGAGAGMWPGVILGAVAIGRSRPLWLKWSAGLIALALQVQVLQSAVGENWRFGWPEKAMASAWYLPLFAIEAWAFSVVFAPNLERVATSTWARRVLVGAAVIAFAGAARLMGLAGM
jgi:hypothetical protein